MEEVKATKKIIKFLKKALIIIVIQFLVLCIFSIPMVMYGPFNNLRAIYVTTAMTTFNHQYLARIFLSDASIKEIMDKNNVNVEGKTTDATAIKTFNGAGISVNLTSVKSAVEDKLELINISNNRYKGYILRVTKPERVSVGTTDKLNKYGAQLEDIIKNNNAVGGINAGGFMDDKGVGSGGTPIGALVKDGEILYGSSNEKYNIIGFNNNSVLVLGSFTLQEIKDQKIRDAVTFDPFLIINGEPTIKDSNYVGGLQPRTAIGQMQDGTVLFLVIDGRQVGSLGATLKEVQDILLSYGALNAANLDGGASTEMIYDGKIINHPCSSAGPRYLPSAFIIKQSDN